MRGTDARSSADTRSDGKPGLDGNTGSAHRADTGPDTWAHADAKLGTHRHPGSCRII